MSVKLTSPDKVLWPAAGYTKADLRDYYERAAPRLLPQFAGRPLTLKRFPDGVDGEGFFQKHLPDSAPEFVSRFPTWSESSGRHVNYALVDELEDLRWLAQVAALELHPWFSRVDRPDRADLLVFDLDPAEPGQAVAPAARWLKAMLDALELPSMVKTSGKRGLHLYVPVQRRYRPSDLRGFGLAVARACAAEHPDELTVEMRKAERNGKLLVDWSRNGPAQHLVAAWSPRATPHATVSTPLVWDEVDHRLDPSAFTLATVLDRPDPWADPPPPQRIERARRALADAGFPSIDRSPRART